MHNIKPKLELTLSPFDKVMEVLGWASLFMLWALVLLKYSSLPAIIPIHFNAIGDVDRYGKKEIIFLLPIMGTVLYMGLTALTKYPHLYNYSSSFTTENARYHYTNATRLIRFLKLVVVLLFLIVVVSTYFVIIGKTTGLGPWFMPLILALMLAPTLLFVVKSMRKK